MAGTRRIKREIEDMNKDPPLAIMSFTVDDDITNWAATIEGPDDSPFAGGDFDISIFFPIDYPFKPPKVKFQTKIYHPNIEEDGKINLPILYDQWSPAITMSDIFESIVLLLEKPDLEYRTVPEIAKVYETDKEKYEETAQEWTEKYATLASE